MKEKQFRQAAADKRNDQNHIIQLSSFTDFCALTAVNVMCYFDADINTSNSWKALYIIVY